MRIFVHGQALPGLVIEIVVKQALLRSVLPNGNVILLVVLHDEHCAVLRNNEIILQARGDADGIDEAVQYFMELTQVTNTLDPEADAQASGDGITRVNDSAAAAPSIGAVAPGSAIPGRSG
ncbi:MAG: hypothetical protein QOE14_786 [Humisphaera sp.]|nr:hypothetical protein [Humisphaera sp.]